MRLFLLFLTRFSVRHLGLLILLSTGLLAQAQTIRYVKPVATGTGDGSSWANASGNLQAMINASTPNNQVWVAAGTYKPTTTTDRYISFSMKAGVAIYGGFMGTETTLGARGAVNPITGNPSSTTLSGEIGNPASTTDNSYHVIQNSIELTNTAILDGFVITGGNANGDSQSGGGMRNVINGDRANGYADFKTNSPLIRNCLFQANSAADFGGAISNESNDQEYSNVESSPTLINCSFQANSSGYKGGAIANETFFGKASPTLINCSFKANSASSGGAMSNSAYRLFSQSSPTLTNCSFETNAATLGGAMHNSATSNFAFGESGGDCNPILTNCSFLNNRATTSGNNASGGAIHNSAQLYNRCIPSFTNCSFQGNLALGGAGTQGGAISSYGTQDRNCATILTNCVLFGNGGVQTFYSGDNNIYTYVYGSYTVLDASVTNYTDNGGTTRVTVSPFANVTSVALAANSPAINAGDPQTTTATVGTTDLAGNPRIVGCKLDMGALEFQYTYLPLAINAQPATSSVVCAGKAISVPVGVSGTVQGYQWYKDSFANPVAGQNTATLTLGNPQTGDAGSYSLVVTSSCNSLTTTAFNLTVNSLPPVSISPSSVNICQGQSVLLTASGASTGETLSYTWSNTTTGNTLSATATGTYSVTGVNGNGCANTATATVTVHNPAVRISPSSVSICQGQSALLTASGTSTYTWSNTTTGNTLSATTTGTYSVTGVDSYGCSNTATATVTVNSLPTVSISSSPSATVIQGNSVTLIALATGATLFTWNTGSTSSSIVISPTTSALYSVTARSGAGCVASASLTITVTPPACGPVIYVTQQGAGQRDGSSWSDALGDNQLQLAINTAANCGGNGQVWVATGIYKPTSNTDRNASFALRNGVAIYGGFMGDETTLSARPAINPVAGSGGASQPNAARPSSTTLSGDIGTVGNGTDNSFHVINNPLGLTTTAVLDGFVITGGAGSALGGGMSNVGSSPTIRNCSFLANSVSALGTAICRGGGMYNGNGSNPQLTNCFFRSNTASSSSGFNGFGGAIANFTNSSPLLINCVFQANSVSGSSTNYGGAMANTTNCSPQLTNCSFLNNSASGSGSSPNYGGAMANTSSSPKLTNCSFLSNTVSGGTNSPIQGGAIFNTSNSSPQLTNCSFLSNTGRGGAMANVNNTSNGSPQLINCVVFGNGGGSTFFNSNSPVIAATYSLFDNTVTGYSSDPTNLTVSTSPFASSTSVDLAANSPAIDAGLNSASGLTDISTDLAGNPRLVGCKVDMGALEFQGNTDQTFSITAQPASASVVCVGSPLTVPVGVSGTVTAYQWYKDNFANPVAGQTSATLALTNVQPVDGGSYSLVVTGTCNSLTSTAFSLTVNSPPTVATAGASQTITTGTGATLAANTPTLGTGSWSVVSGPSVDQAQFSNVTNPAAVFTPAGGMGSYDLVWTITNSPCTPSSSPLTITVIRANTAPVATDNTNQTATVGTAFTYTVNAFTDDQTPSALTYTASLNPANGFSFDPLTRVISGTPISALVSSITIIATDTGGLSGSTTFSITTSCFPLTASISGALTVCAGQSTALTASGGNTYLWNTGAITPTISATAGAYSVTVTTSGCSATATATVTADPLIVATLLSSGTLTCATTSVTLTAGGGSSYTFSAGATQLGSSNQASVNTAGTYSVTVATPSGCTAAATTTVVSTTASPSVDITPSSTTLTCASPSVSLTASGGGSYRWEDNSTNAVRAVSVAGLYSVTVTNLATGCFSTTSVSVSEDKTPPTASLVSSGTLSCAVMSVTLTAGTGTSYAFSAGAIQIGSTNQAVVSTPGIYTVTVSNASGCTATATANVGSNTAAPTVSITPSSPTLTCASPTASLTAIGSGSVRWNTGETTPVISVSVAGPYSVTATGGNGCSAVASVSVSQDNTTPVATLSASPSATLTCAQNSLTLTAGGGNSYAFSGPGVVSQGGNTAVVNAAGIYSVTVSNANGCTATAAATVFSNTTAPTATLTASTLRTCAPAIGTPTAITLTAAGTGSSFTFSAGATQIGTTNQATVIQSGTYWVTVSNASGCTATASTSVTVNTPPSAPTLTGLSRTVSASNTPLPLAQFVSAPGTLSFSGVSGAIANPPTGTPAAANISTGGVQNFQVTQTDANGCTSGATPFSITVLPPTPGNQTVCRSSLVVLTALTTGVRYEWYKNGQSAPFKLTEIASIQRGTATSSLTLVSIQTTASYYCKVFQANGSFTFDGPLKVTVDYGCIAPGARLAAHAVAAAEVAEVPLSITLTPNPVVDGQLKAVVRGGAGEALSVELLDLNGQVVRSQHWAAAAGEQVIEWNIAAQPAGLYLLQAQTAGQRSTAKVIHR